MTDKQNLESLTLNEEPYIGLTELAEIGGIFLYGGLLGFGANRYLIPNSTPEHARWFYNGLALVSGSLPISVLKSRDNNKSTFYLTSIANGIGYAFGASLAKHLG